MPDRSRRSRKVVLVSIGDELLIGQTINTNAAWLGDQLASIGWQVVRGSIAPDDRKTIAEEIRAAASAAPLVITSGGLGPTHDDVTREAICDLLECDLETDENQLALIEERFRERGIKLNERSRRQAIVPAACGRLLNYHGSAPGLAFHVSGADVYALPGVPSELKGLFEDHIKPTLASAGGSLERQVFLLFGIPESALADALVEAESLLDNGVTLAYLPSTGGIRIRVMQTEETLDAGTRFRAIVALIRAKADEWVVSERDETMEVAMGRALVERGLTVAAAESCTGGMLGSVITSVPGASAWFRGGVVSYANEVKHELLGVPDRELNLFGAVSAEVACSMATGVRAACSADIGVAITGIAGPDGGTEEKPVGTVFIAVATARGVSAERYQFGNGRETVRERSVATAANAVRLAALGR